MARRLQVAVRRSPRTQMPLLGDKFKITTSLRVPLGLWQWPWLIKACLYSDRLWSNLTSGTPATAVRFGNRPAPSAGRHLTGQKGFRASPTHKAAGRDFFVASKQRFHLSPVCEAVGAVPKLSTSSDAGQLLGRMVAAGDLLRAEGFPKRRC